MAALRGPGGQAGGDAIGPDRLGQALDPRAREQDQAHEDERRQRQIAPVRGRGHRRRRVVPQDDGEIELTEHPRHHAQPDEKPRHPLARADPRAHQTQGSPDRHGHEVQPLLGSDRQPAQAEGVRFTGSDPASCEYQYDTDVTGHEVHIGARRAFPKSLPGVLHPTPDQGPASSSPRAASTARRTARASPSSFCTWATRRRSEPSRTDRGLGRWLRQNPTGSSTEPPRGSRRLRVVWCRALAP